MKEYIEELIASVAAKNPGEVEFQQAVLEVFHSIRPVLEKNPRYMEAGISRGWSSPSGRSFSASRGWTTMERFR